MDVRISEEMGAILRFSGQEAVRTGFGAIEPDHLVLGMLRHHDNDACGALCGMGVDTGGMKDFIDSAIFRGGDVSFPATGTPKLTVAAQSVMSKAALEALKAGTDTVEAVHLLLAVFGEPSGNASAYLEENGISHDISLQYVTSHGMMRNTGHSK